jgi:hypothetical protein
MKKVICLKVAKESREIKKLKILKQEQVYQKIGLLRRCISYNQVVCVSGTADEFPERKTFNTHSAEGRSFEKTFEKKLEICFHKSFWTDRLSLWAICCVL